MNIKINRIPRFMQAEMAQLQSTLSPLLKKNMKYRLLSTVMIGFSIINLFFLLFKGESLPISKIALGIYALVGAVGFALLKENKHNQKEIVKMSQKYMLERMKKSNYLTDARKSNYYKRVNDQPLFAMNVFFEFLSEEQQRMNRSSHEE
ncbi:DUF5392 family protein [Peribacillus simplex]|uniref:DUF5392 family protein n=2 Tax=Peribacillus simplex TaxID=1478 RepID=A0A223EMK3_9BACI|nr:DUF5392 family protein [Peribacillus simplex]ASS96479.1 hypothetical protein BS1321_22705 [Peribacillus simplex NBRC 15720 = DSM 1321]MEC1397620.1 DUF5392 family protein [Peribacillus simplex]MED3910973.1 DUF5392 family protein [Peribacillus simplex]MED3985655.1 DUF5392 family protein [Peribacillus simplex]MED4096393.1 DUF5392 family protein [Peribacillus simplex]